MEPKALMNADYLDIIFDNRNKIYGGYELRRNYNRRVKKALGIMLLGMSAIISFSFVVTSHTEKPVRPNTKPTIICSIGRITPPPPAQQIPCAVMHPAPHMNIPHLAPPQIVENTEVPDLKPTPQNEEPSTEQPGAENAQGDAISRGPDNSPGNSTSVASAASSNSNTPVRWVEQMPEFPGDMSEYISNHIHYPTVASEGGIEGKVIVAFVVNEDGVVSDVKVLRGIGGGCDEEAVRMVNGMPKWKPGKQNGVPVKVLFTLPITFVLN